MIPPDLGSEEFTLDELLTDELIFGAEFFRTLAAGMGNENASFCDLRRISLSIEPPFSDFSRFDQLCVRAENLSSHELLMSLTIMHGAEPGVGSPTSFSGGREKLLPGEVRDIFFPVECFGIYGFPSGWSNITRIELGFFPERGFRPSTPVCVSIHSLSAQSRRIPQGPRLTEKGLLTQLKPGIGPDEAAEAAHAACMDFVRYCGSKIAPPHSYPRNSAEEIIQGRIMGQNPGNPVDWNYNPLGSLEWTHFLNRHHFLADLAAELSAVKDPKFAEAISSFIEDWITENPVPIASNGGAGPTWETLSIAWRLREWMWIIGTAWEYGSFRESTKLMMLRSVWEHCTSLLHHKGHANNWIIVESCALLCAGMCFRIFSESDKWVSEAVEHLGRELKRQFFQDGVHFEISPFYHAICLHAIMEVKICADSTETFLPLPLTEILEKGFDYLAAICRPDFTWPSINDSGSADSDYSDLMLMAARILNRDDFLWVGSHGSIGRSPSGTFRSFPDAGIAVMRSHYGPDANHLVFRAGPSGAAHAHGDRLSLDVAANGVPRLTDPGITSYAPGELTDYYRSAEAHNMVLVDGKGPDSSPDFYLPDPENNPANCSGILSGDSSCRSRRSESRIRPAGERFAVTSDGKTASGFWVDEKLNCVVSRSAHFIKNSFWILHDRIHGDGAHDMTVCWNFFPNSLEPITKDSVIRLKDPLNGDFEIIPLQGECDPVIQIGTGRIIANNLSRSDNVTMGWVSLKGTDVPAPSVRYTFYARLPVSLIWILIPSAERAGMEFRRDDSGGSLTVVVKHACGDIETVGFPGLD